jgi:sugar/nucleoside kinase (ribokinase family)
MLLMTAKQELKVFLQKPKEEKCKVAVLPDFFLDRFVNLNFGVQGFTELLIDKVNRKGGSIDGISQTDTRGGNAINVASALANLGALVTPIVCTSEYGLQQLKYYLRELNIDFSHVKIRERISITTALEFKKQDEKTNVMIRDVGSLADFGPNDLDERDFKEIEDANYACLFNWAGTLKHGTELVQAVFDRAKIGKSRTYFDTADPSPNKEGIAELMKYLLKSNKIDIISVNENEAITYASAFDNSFNSKVEELSFPELAMKAARVLALNFSARIDLHTTDFSATFSGKDEVVVPTFKINVLRATGAGDAWTAGNILGDWTDLSDEGRLTLANAVSACYLSDLQGKHPSWSKLSSFLNNAL